MSNPLVIEAEIHCVTRLNNTVWLRINEARDNIPIQVDNKGLKIFGGRIGDKVKIMIEVPE